jgi:peptide/nickel transport system substrate-binding protein
VAGTNILNIGDIVDQVAGPGDAAFAFPCIEPLLRLDGNSNFQPWLAEKFEIADDFSSMTFYLRKGINFHDGTPLNAEAVKEVMEIAIANPIYTQGHGFSDAEVIDEYTVKLNFKDGQWNWDSAKGVATWWGMLMFSPTSLKNHDSDWRKTHVVGTGPFILKEFIRDQKLVYDKNTDYWRGEPYLDGIDYQIIPDPTTQLLSFKAGEVDVVGLQLKDVDSMKAEGYGVIESEDMIINTALIPASKDPNSPLHDIRVRQAVQYAINQDEFITGVTYGYGHPSQQAYCVPPYENPDVAGYPYDPDKAKELLEAAGYGEGLTLTCNIGDTMPMDAPLLLQDMLSRVGITLEMNKVSYIQIGSIIQNDGWNGFMYSYDFPGRTIDPGFTASIYMNHGGVWISQDQPADIQALVDQAATEPDIAKRTALYQQISKMMTDFSFHQWLYWTGTFMSVNPELKGHTIGQYKEFYAYTFAYYE